jgi:hypothetical protein
LLPWILHSWSQMAVWYLLSWPASNRFCLYKWLGIIFQYSFFVLYFWKFDYIVTWEFLFWLCLLAFLLSQNLGNFLLLFHWVRFLCFYSILLLFCLNQLYISLVF